MSYSPLSYSNQISFLSTAMHEVASESPYTFFDKVQPLIDTIFGTPHTEGLLQSLSLEMESQSPSHWSHKFESLLNLIGPQSEFFSKIQSNPNLRITIPNSTIIPSLLYQNEEINEQYKVLELKHEFNRLTVPLLDWFYMVLVSTPMPNFRLPKLQLEQDDFYHMITHNPHLYLISRYLLSAPSRLIAILDAQIITPYTIHHRFTSKSPSLHHLLLVYLLIYTRKHSEKYKEYFDSVSENIHNSDTLRVFLRVWMYYLSKGSIENKVIELLKKANPEDGWYELERYTNERYEEENSAVIAHTFSYTKVKNNIMKSIKGNYYLDITFLHTYYCFLSLENKYEESLFTFKVTEKILRENNSKSEYTNRFIDYVKKIFSMKYNRSFAEDSRENISKNTSFSTVIDYNNGNESILGNENRHYIKYSEPRVHSCWEYPLQDNEYYILYKIFYWISAQVEKLMPGKRRKHPRMNLRFLCNTMGVFLITVLILCISYFC